MLWISDSPSSSSKISVLVQLQVPVETVQFRLMLIGVNGQFQKIEKQSYASAATGMPSVPTVQMVS